MFENILNIKFETENEEDKDYCEKVVEGMKQTYKLKSPIGWWKTNWMPVGENPGEVSIGIKDWSLDHLITGWTHVEMRFFASLPEVVEDALDRLKAFRTTMTFFDIYSNLPLSVGRTRCRYPILVSQEAIFVHVMNSCRHLIQ